MKKLNKKNIQAILNFIKSQFDENDTKRANFSLYIDDVTANIHISDMYDFVPINFDTMKFFSRLFGSKKIHMDEISIPGCGTCDYGSSYEKHFIIENIDIEHIINNLEVMSIMEG